MNQADITLWTKHI